MKNFTKRIGIIAFMVVIGLVTATCVEYEEKHGSDFDLSLLTGTWKAPTIKHPGEIVYATDVTVVFDNVINGKIKMTLSVQEHYHTGGGTGGQTTGSVFFDSLFGLSPYKPGPNTTAGTDAYDVWERSYTRKEVKTLQWDLRTLGNDAQLSIYYLIPAGECDCEDCTHYYDVCCNDKYCGTRPQGDLGALLGSVGTFKKQ